MPWDVHHVRLTLFASGHRRAGAAAGWWACGTRGCQAARQRLRVSVAEVLHCMSRPVVV